MCPETIWRVWPISLWQCPANALLDTDLAAHVPVALHHQYVCGLQIVVQNSGLHGVQVRHGRGHVVGHVKFKARLVHHKRRIREEVLQAAAGAVLHHDHGLGRVQHHTKQLNDVGVPDVDSSVHLCGWRAGGPPAQRPAPMLLAWANCTQPWRSEEGVTDRDPLTEICSRPNLMMNHVIRLAPN